MKKGYSAFTAHEPRGGTGGLYILEKIPFCQFFCLVLLDEKRKPRNWNNKKD
jgi:hypothetical protein